MKKVVFTGSVALMLLMTGCSTKEPAIDATKQTGDDVTQVTDKTVDDTEIKAMDQGDVTTDGAMSAEEAMAAAEAKFETINFDFDKYDIRTDMQNRVDNNVNLAKTDAEAYVVKLEGNCDEWGSDEYNYALGLRRANAVKEAMVFQGVPADRITMTSYGETKPLCSEKTQDCWAQNRRVDSKLLP